MSLHWSVMDRRPVQRVPCLWLKDCKYKQVKKPDGWISAALNFACMHCQRKESSILVFFLVLLSSRHTATWKQLCYSYIVTRGGCYGEDDVRNQKYQRTQRGWSYGEAELSNNSPSVECLEKRKKKLFTSSSTSTLPSHGCPPKVTGF